MPLTAKILIEGLRLGGEREVNEIPFNHLFSSFGKPSTLPKPPNFEGKIVSGADAILSKSCLVEISSESFQ